VDGATGHDRGEPSHKRVTASGRLAAIILRMRNIRKVAVAILLLIAGIAGFVWFISGQGLDRVEKWISIAGVVTSVGLSAAGVFLAFLALRQPRPAATSPPSTLASGVGAVAVGGGNESSIVTTVSGTHPPAAPGVAGAGDGVTASGTGAAAVGGDNRGSIRTNVTGPDRGAGS
jgi:hypothetical protein